MPCYCESCTKEPKETYTRSYRHKKEVDFIATKNQKWIKEFLIEVEKKRGFAAANKLRMDVWEIWRKR